MIKKSILLFMLVVFVMAIAGCETIKGALRGAKKDCQSAIQGTKKVCQVPVQGAKKSWQAVKAVDNWMQKHLW